MQTVGLAYRVTKPLLPFHVAAPVQFVTKDNICALFDKHGVPTDFELLTIDARRPALFSRIAELPGGGWRQFLADR